MTNKYNRFYGINYSEYVTNLSRDDGDLQWYHCYYLQLQTIQQTRTALALGCLYHTVRFTNCRRLRMTDFDILVTTITTFKTDLKSLPQHFTTQARRKKCCK